MTWSLLRDYAELSAAIWDKSASLIGLFSAIEASVGVNLAYSVLFKLGRFTGALIDVWAKNESVRVLAVLSENPKFNATKFTGDLSKINRRFQRASYWISSATVTWALIAITAAVALLVVAPFYEHQVKGYQAFGWALLLFGAVPTGLFLSGVVHAAGRFCMYRNSSDYNILIEYAIPPKAEIQSALSKIKRKKAVR